MDCKICGADCKYGGVVSDGDNWLDLWTCPFCEIEQKT